MIVICSSIDCYGYGRITFPLLPTELRNDQPQIQFPPAENTRARARARIFV